MGEYNYSKILYFIGFIILALISCWATSESFKLLLPTWPPVLCWGLAIAFFIIASLGTKLIVDSLNQNIYMEKRGLFLVFGFILVILFWGVCSMPTNTHTFFYRNYINQKLSTDLTLTQGYLAQIKNNTRVEQLIQTKCNELENKVNTRLGELEAEIKNEANPGFGPKSNEILASFANLLGVPKIDPLTYKGTSIQERQKLCDAYRNKILTLSGSKKENIRLSLMPKNKDYRKIADVVYKNLIRVDQYIHNGTLNVNEPKDIHEICNQLNKGYSTIKTYNQYVVFQNANDKERYTKNNPETRVQRMLNVYDVWTDFLNGDFPGSFIFWIVISILVDVAAFIFFDLTFRKTEF